MQAPWRHCCLECRYPAGHPEEQSISIRYLDSEDDFEIVARALADAFALLQARGWELAGVSHDRSSRRRRGAQVGGQPIRTDRYYFKRSDGKRVAP